MIKKKTGEIHSVAYKVKFNICLKRVYKLQLSYKIFKKASSLNISEYYLKEKYINGEILSI